MIGAGSRSSSVKFANQAVQPSITFRRNISKRKIAYPPYPTKKLNNVHPKLHQSNLRFAMQQFLGPKNVCGEYHRNRYYYPQENHEPNFIKPEFERGATLVVDEEDSKLMRSGAIVNKENRRVSYYRKLQPFPGNSNCRTNLYISNKTKDSILYALESEEKTVQEVAYQFDISIPRVEALVKLNKIEQEWSKQNKISPDLKKMSLTLYKMFPLYDQTSHPENLTEIPTPAKTLKSRFLTIAESEPFGPVDAANVLGLEPASETLEKLSRGHDADGKTKTSKGVEGFYAPVLKHEKAIFRFKTAKVGEVGVRYGKSNRDSKKDRKVGYNGIGQRIYI